MKLFRHKVLHQQGIHVAQHHHSMYNDYKSIEVITNDDTRIIEIKNITAIKPLV